MAKRSIVRKVSRDRVKKGKVTIGRTYADCLHRTGTEQENLEEKKNVNRDGSKKRSCDKKLPASTYLHAGEQRCAASNGRRSRRRRKENKKKPFQGHTKRYFLLTLCIASTTTAAAVSVLAGPALPAPILVCVLHVGRYLSRSTFYLSFLLVLLFLLFFAAVLFLFDSSLLFVLLLSALIYDKWTCLGSVLAE